MASTTDTRLRAQEIPRGSLRALVAAAVLVLMFAVLLIRVADDRYDPERQVARQIGMFQYPHALAAGLTIARALQEYSHKPLEGLRPRTAALMLIGFLSTFAIGMPILLGSLRQRLIEGRAVFLRIGAVVGFLLGGFWALSIFPVTYFQRQVRTSLAAAQGIQRVRDEMITTMTETSVVARQYARRPVRYGGGGGSFTGFILPSRFATTTRVNYEASVQDTMVVFTGRLRIDPVSVFTAAPELPAPDWTVRCTVSRSGDAKFEYTGEFE